MPLYGHEGMSAMKRVLARNRWTHALTHVNANTPLESCVGTKTSMRMLLMRAPVE